MLKDNINIIDKKNPVLSCGAMYLKLNQGYIISDKPPPYNYTSSHKTI
jgi:hypothetical protein